MAIDSDRNGAVLKLPIDSEIPKILAELKSHANLVLVASPGAGKTTRVPAALMRSGILSANRNGILMLEPRRLAARAAATRIAQENGWALGGEVGYQVRFENRTSDKTQLCVMTEGLLSKRLIQDPELQDIGCVILDEFHERSWHSDIGLGLLKELQQLSRPDLKIIVMSATIQADTVSKYLDEAPIVEVKGQLHPISVHYERDAQLLTTGPDFIAKLSGSIDDVLLAKKESRGDILVFLPGLREIHRVSERVQSAASQTETEIHLLHGSLRLEDQDRAIQPSTKRKLILSTNIAETSLTIDGVATVIDSGLARVSRQDTNGFPRLELSRISLFSAIQRMGRSGRQGPGVCYRLWNKMDEASMNESEAPEIKRIDLTEAALLLAAHGIRDWPNFSWFEPPPKKNLDAAATLLERLSAVRTEAGLPEITPLGRRLLHWPLHPRLAAIMEAALRTTLDLRSVAEFTALVSEKDIVIDASSLKSHSNLESDLLLRLEILNSNRPSVAIDRAAIATVRRSAEQIEKTARRFANKTGSSLNADLGEILLFGFPDRICRRRKPKAPEARMVGGKGVKLASQSTVEHSELFLAIDAITAGQAASAKGDAMITIASRVERKSIERFFSDRVHEERRTELDPESGKVMNQIAHFYFDLPLEEPRLAPASADDVMRVLPKLVAGLWPEIAKRNEIFKDWLARFDFLKTNLPEVEWPFFDLLDSSSPEIQTLIETVSLGEKSPTALFEKDFRWALTDVIGSELSRLLENEAPEFIQVPTGSRLKVHYPPERHPYIEVRLQEVFGWLRGPVLAKGKVSLLLHLLGPNYRPVQVTQDLEGFWRGSYNEVRKELRARYPKHSWPDDPLTAKPEAKGRPRK